MKKALNEHKTIRERKKEKQRLQNKCLTARATHLLTQKKREKK